MKRRTLAGDLRVARTATHYLLALLWAKAKDWADGAVTVAAAVVLLPATLLIYALFR